MGMQADLAQGGRCVVARMRLRHEPFETLSGMQNVPEVTFSTIGPDRIKCLAPRMLFQLPMLRIVDCRDATSIEARIRLAWQKHLSDLRRAASWLDTIGAEFAPAEQGSIVTFPIAGEASSARVAMVEPQHAILPGPGPLAGIALQRAEDRVVRVDRSVTSSVDLEIALSTRMEELVRIDRRLAEERRRAAMTAADAMSELGSLDDKPDKTRAPRLLLVGSHLVTERTCIESLRLRGYDVDTARSQQEALQVLDRSSPELVMVDMNLGRGDGIEIIPSLRQVPGIEEVPVVLIDEHRRSARREAARRMGAAGYLVHPLDVSRIARRLSKIVNEPSRRRFTRYAQRLSVKVSGTQSACLATAFGRGGMFVATDEDLPATSVHACELSVPSLGRSLQVEAEVLYRMGGAGSKRRGVGMRFRRFDASDEPAWIGYLATLEPQAAAAG